jgi:hypothetical protein
VPGATLAAPKLCEDETSPRLRQRQAIAEALPRSEGSEERKASCVGNVEFEALDDRISLRTTVRAALPGRKLPAWITTRPGCRRPCCATVDAEDVRLHLPSETGVTQGALKLAA